MKFGAALFDLDGTLLDTLEDLGNSMNRALGRLGFPPREMDVYKELIGDGLIALAARSLPDGHRDEPAVKRCVEAMLDEYGRHWADVTRPYDGVPELLDALAARGLKLAVLSNKLDDFTKLCVSRFLPNAQFAAVRGVTDAIPKKPDPAGALAIARDLGIPPSEFVYLGDTATDMKTAVAAGMAPVGVLWGFRSAEELTAGGAKVLIARPLDLLNVL